MAERFGLGYAPDGDALGRYLNQRGDDPELAAEAGLLSERDTVATATGPQPPPLPYPHAGRSRRGFGRRALGDAMPKI